MSLTDNPLAVAAAIRAYADTKANTTMANIHQGPGEGNYERIEMLSIEAAIRAAEKFGLPLDERDTLVMHPLPNLERTHANE